MAQREKYMPILKKYLYRTFVEMILKSFVTKDLGVKIPMLPEDYFDLDDMYMRYDMYITLIADKFNR